MLASLSFLFVGMSKLPAMEVAYSGTHRGKM